MSFSSLTTGHYVGFVCSALIISLSFYEMQINVQQTALLMRKWMNGQTEIQTQFQTEKRDDKIPFAYNERLQSFSSSSLMKSLTYLSEYHVSSVQIICLSFFTRREWKNHQFLDCISTLNYMLAFHSFQIGWESELKAIFVFWRRLNVFDLINFEMFNIVIPGFMTTLLLDVWCWVSSLRDIFQISLVDFFVWFSFMYVHCTFFECNYGKEFHAIPLATL